MGGFPSLVVGSLAKAKASRRAAARARRVIAEALAPVLAVAGFVVAGTVAATAGSVVAAAPARASSVSVLILSTSVNGGSSSAEAQAVAAVSPGATVQVDTPSAWETLAAGGSSGFAAYSAIIIGDPSSGGSCSASAPSDALSTESTWGAAVTGNVAVLGTAPALAGSAGTALMDDAVRWALAGSGTGLYMSLNCDYAGSSVTDADAALLDGVGGGGFDVTGQNSQGPACSDSGTVNTWEADSTASFAGLDSSALSASSWAPGCPVQETFSSWPATFTPVAYDAAASPAQFTASDGQTGQPYVLAGTPAPSAAVQAIAPSQGGAVLAGTVSGGGSNPAASGVNQAASGGGGAGVSPGSSAGSSSGPVDTEDGDFTQSDTDLSVPTFGPGLDFTRTYDAQLAEQQTRSATPGPLGFGWTDNWATSLSAGNPVPGDMYSLDGLATDTGNGAGAAMGPLDYPDTTVFTGGNVYIVDTAGNRVEEVPGSSGTQWGISMTAGDMYTIAGSPAGAYGDSPNGTANEAPGGGSLLNTPGGLAFDSAGDLYVADSGNNRVLEVPVASGTQRGVSMTADDVYTVAGNWGGSQGHSGDGGAATSAFLSDPVGLAIVNGGSDLYIADAGNNRVQEVAGENGAQWGMTPAFTANDIYTIAGSPTGTAGASGDGGAATSALLGSPEGVSLSSSGDLYVADTGNNRVQEIPASSGAQWGITPAFTADDIYTVAGSATGNSGTTGDGGKATLALLAAPASVECDNGTQLYIADSGNNRVQEVARTGHAEWGINMTADDVYTIAGSASGTAGYSGDGGAATSALLHDPGQVALDGTADLWIADTDNNRVREVKSSTGDITDFAGDGQTLASAGNSGPAVDAELFRPAGEAEDARGNVYIADAGNNRVQEIPATDHAQWGIAMTAGDVYTVAGSAYGYPGDSGDGGAATSALLNDPYGIAVDSAGNLFIADQGNNRVQEVSAATGDISTIAGSAAGAGGYTPGGGPATSALLSAPHGVAVDDDGDIYIADSGNNRVEEVYASGGKSWGQAMTAGDMYTIAGSASATSGLSGDGGAATSALLFSPQSLAFSPAGDLYIGDTRNCRVQEIPATTSGGMTKNDIYTIAGSPGGACGSAGDGGPAVSALLSQPAGMAADANGDLYIADGNNDRVQEIPAASGAQWGKSMTAGDMYTVAGSGTKGESGDGGPATAAKMSFAIGVSVDSAGNLYIADWAGNHLREVTASAQATITAAPGQASSLYPAPGSTTAGTTYPGGITVTQPGGAQVTFYTKPSGTCATGYTKDVSGTYCIQPQDEGASLTWNSGPGTWSFTPDPGDTTYTYTSSASGGTLASETDTAGDTLTATYNTPAPGTGNCPAAASSCETISAANGRTLVIGSNGLFQVTSVTDPMGREWTYGYNSAGNLTSAADPMGNLTTYTYGQGGTGNPLLASDLVTITGPNAQPGGPDAGDDTTITYNKNNQTFTQTDPMGQKATFSYCSSMADGNCMNTATGNGIVTATGPGGNTTVYDYDEGTLAAQSDWTSGTTLTSETDNLPDTTTGTLNDTATFDGNGNKTSYLQYNADGNPTQTQAPDGTGRESTTYLAYTALQDASCTTNAEATTSSCTGPPPVAPGGVISPPSAAPPLGVTETLYDTDGNELYTTTGVYQPGATSASYQQTTYQLFNGNTVTLPGTSTAVRCATGPPSRSLPCATVNADGVVTQLAYNSVGDLTSSSKPDGNGTEIAQTTFAYDSDGEQTSTTVPDGNLSGVNAGNYTTITTYNADGKKKTVSQAGGPGASVTPRTTTYGYDADGNTTSAEDARGYTTTTAYNADDEPVLITDPDGNAALTCYDADGNVAQTVPPRGVAGSGLTASSCPASYPAGYSDRLALQSTVDTYDADGNLTSETTPAPAGQSGYESTTYSYDGDGNLIKTTAPPASNGGQNQVTVDTYNAAGDLSSQTAGSGTSAASTVSYCYDSDGNETAVVYGDGNTSGTAACSSSAPWTVIASPQAAYQTTYAYDSAGELVSTTAPQTTAAPSGGTTVSTYDAAGNMLTRKDPEGVTATWTYTPANEPATVSYSGASAHGVTYTYDADGNQTGMTDANGTSADGYDSFGELTSAENGAGKTTTYGYNADGQVTGITYPLPSTASWATSDAVSYGYDNADELTSATDFNGHHITVSNTADGLPNSEALGSTGDTIATTYGNSDTPSVITLKNSSSTLQSFAYSDSPAGTILSETDTPSSPLSPAEYTYSAKGHVTSETPGSGPTQNYGFDASSNLKNLPTGASGTYDDAGELTSSTLSGTTTSYTYNADGEQLTSAQGSTAESSATWNGAEQLTAYSDSAANMTTATYSGDGLRASDTIDGSTNSFTWSAAGTLPKMIMDSGNAYIYTNFIAPTEQVNLANGAVTYLVTDSLGSVRATVNAAGAVTSTTSYDAWGNPSTPGGLGAVTPFGFAGNYTDATGLQYLINRYYLSAEGQFMSVDSDLSQTLEPYIYASGNPVSRIDPSGNSSSNGCTLRTHYIHLRTSSDRTKIGYKPEVTCDQFARKIQIDATIFKEGCWDLCDKTVFFNDRTKEWTYKYIRKDVEAKCINDHSSTYWGSADAWVTFAECLPNGTNKIYLDVTETPHKAEDCGM